MNLTDIPVGRENAITSDDLALKCGISKRSARRQIQQLRKQCQGKHIIMSTSHATGYWLSDSPDDMDKIERELLSRVRNELEVVQAVRRIRRNLNQTRLPV